jgi:hypothetical protein
MKSEPTITMPCPQCGRRISAPLATYFYCRYCRLCFDDDPNDGGDYSDRNPAARIEREERRKARARAKAKRR